MGDPLVIDGLWGLRFGSGLGNGGNSHYLYFTAGPNDETNGLFGSIAPAPEPASALLLLAGSFCLVGWRSWTGRSR